MRVERVNFNRYFNNHQLEEALLGYAERYPALAQLDTLGMSYDSRPIWLVTVTNQETGAALEKPAIWLDGNLHATEIAGTTMVIHILHTLVEGYGSDDRITRLVDTCTFYLAPRLNPDGAELALAQRPRFLRSGVRPYPYSEPQEGLHAEDLDGDGRILQMRLVDPSGDWKISSLDPRLMERRAPDDHGGTYYRLFPEGRIEDYDGYLIKVAPPLEGLDFNRNFPFEWRPESAQKGAGPFPTSEAEIRAAAAFITAAPNINLALTYHTYSGVILRPYSTRPDEEMDTEDLWTFQEIARRGTALTGYPHASVFHDFRYHPKEVITGGFDDWMYEHLGVYAFTVELWDLVGRAGIKERKFIEWMRNHPHEHDKQILDWIDEHGGSQAYIPWYPYEHPQLGPVELGGWNVLYTWRNPPNHLMGQEAGLNTPFALSLADMLPHLAVRDFTVTELGSGDYHLNLVVENTGYLPTYTNQRGKANKALRPVRVSLDLPKGVSLVSGKQKMDLGHLEGRANKRSLFTVSSSPTDNRARTEWVLRSPEATEVGVQVTSDRAGRLRLQARLDAGEGPPGKTEAGQSNAALPHDG